MRIIHEWFVWENFQTSDTPLAVFQNYLDALFFAAQHMKDMGTQAGVRGWGEDSWWYTDKSGQRQEISLMREDTYK